MVIIKYSKSDLRYIYLITDTPNELKELEGHLNKIPNYMFLPSVSAIPKPEVFLEKFMNEGRLWYKCSAGLWREVVLFFKEHNIQFKGLEEDNYFKYRSGMVDEATFTAWVKSLKLSIEPYDYQIHAVYLILKYRFSISQLATRSGKTLMAYLVFRWMIEVEGANNALMIVPRQFLIEQGVQDFSEYAEFFKSEKVYSKGEYISSSNLTIGTFQTISKKADPKDKHKKYDPKWFNKFDIICCDECHTAKCKSIQNILKLDFVKNAKIRFGFSGSLPPDNTIESFCVQSLIGPCIQDIRSKELQDAGFLAKADITQVIIDHKFDNDLKAKYIKCGEYLVSNYDTINDKKILLPKEQREFTIQHKKSLPYAVRVAKSTLSDELYIDYLVDLCKAQGSNLLMLEQMLVHRDKKRLSVINDLISDMNGNVIVFAHHTEYINYIAEFLKNTQNNREVFIITGSTSNKKREMYQKKMNEQNNIILVASYSCVGTGITFKNLNYGIFAQSFKSEIINKQSIGRGLLKTDSKDTFYLYDIIDKFPTNRLAKHGSEKSKLWKKEGFDLHIINM